MATRAPTYSATGAANDQRVAPRFRLPPTRALLRCAGGSVTDALLHDVSIYGCRLEAGASHEAGDRVSVQLANGAPIPAKVVWNAQNRIACRFDDPIARSLMRSVTLRLV